MALTVAAFTGNSTLLASQSAFVTFTVAALPPQIVLAPSGSQFLVPNERSFTLDGGCYTAWQRRECIWLTHALLDWSLSPALLPASESINPNPGSEPTNRTCKWACKFTNVAGASTPCTDVTGLLAQPVNL